MILKKEQSFVCGSAGKKTFPIIMAKFRTVYIHIHSPSLIFFPAHFLRNVPVCAIDQSVTLHSVLDTVPGTCTGGLCLQGSLDCMATDLKME